MKKDYLHEPLLILVFTPIIMLIVSRDSYLYDGTHHIDSAWFFMCGKAWMNGLTPYVDFADSKGPLLWLIYGLGYLISRYNYNGVFWISCFFYCITYYHAYKTALIVLHDKRKALLVSIGMTIAFFNYWFHDEIRAEDFCVTFIMISLYQSCKLLYSDKNVSNLDISHSFLCFGICIGCTFMIKYNIATIPCFIVLYSIYALIKDKRNLAKPLIWLIGGISIVFLPFILYFIANDCFGNFINEYFLNTYSTLYPDTGLLSSTIQDLYHFLYTPALMARFMIALIGGWLIAYILPRHRWFPLLCIFASISICTLHSKWNYYFQTCSFLSIFLIISLVHPIKRKITKKTIYAFTILVFVFSSLTWLFNGELVLLRDFSNNPDRMYYLTIGSMMKKVNNPKILNLSSHEFGYGIEANSLPAGRYWALQNFATNNMKDGQKAILLNKNADFIIFDETRNASKTNIESSDIINLGYHLIYNWNMYGKAFSLYSKQAIR